MQNTHCSKNRLDTEYYTNSLNNSLNISFDSLANAIGNQLSEFEQIHLSMSKLIISHKYNTEIIDKLAEEIDDALYASKHKIKHNLQKSISNYVNDLESI